MIELPISSGPQAYQEKELPLEATMQTGLPARSEATPQPEPARQQGIGSQWLRWIGERAAEVMCQIEAEERAQWDRLFATTEELEKARSRIRSMEEEIAQAKANAAKLVIAEPA